MKLLLALMSILVLLPFGLAQDEVAAEPTQNIVELASTDPNFSTLVELVTAVGLVETLSDPAAVFTVFAPTNDAFAKVDPATLESLKADPALLTEVLTYHVLPSTLGSADITDGGSRLTVQGEYLSFSTAEGVKVNDATVTTPDIAATNGTIHVIDTVLLPTLLGKEKVGVIRYPIAEVDGSGIRGVLIVKGDTRNSTVTVVLQGTPEGGQHPVSLYTGNCGAEDEAVVLLNDLNGTTGTSRTVVNIPYGTIVGGDHSLDVHVSAADLATIVACGEVGEGATGR
ncbi:MAG: fasciclin domain-containing protein [Trueperaceae bacterium]